MKTDYYKPKTSPDADRTKTPGIVTHIRYTAPELDRNPKKVRCQVSDIDGTSYTKIETKDIVNG